MALARMLQELRLELVSCQHQREEAAGAFKEDGGDALSHGGPAPKSFLWLLGECGCVCFWGGAFVVGLKEVQHRRWYAVRQCCSDSIRPGRRAPRETLEVLTPSRGDHKSKRAVLGVAPILRQPT